MNLYRSHQKALRFIASILLIQRRVKCLSLEEKAPSRSAFSASMYVVLKTKYVNPNIHVRRYQSHVRSPNLSTTRPQLYIPTQSNNLIEVTLQSYIRISPKLYSFLRHPIQLYPRTHITIMRPLRKPTSSLLIPSSLFFPRKSESLGREVRRRKVQAVKIWPCAMVS